ncbi:hypothetical protein GWO43_27920 [candidate division KSB1 bacterium]|nr:hypothetical protein [candidate division KSB1 bacterium]NIT74618.1 hypothetical protein [candidate division KSB1 bacterium]NIX74298.1 hypothetical protein [candidate division KSB1 bacterium]
MIVEESPWQQNHEKIPPNKIIYIRVDYGEIYLGRLARAVGGQVES